MSRLETFSEYVEKIVTRLQSGSRSNQNVVLVREIAELRMQVRSLAHSVSALASYQEIADQLKAPEDGSARPPLPRVMRIDAAQHLQLLDGFYSLEYTPSGLAYRWTGPMRRFRFTAWIDRTVPVDARLRVIAPGHFANLLNTRLFVDDVEYKVDYRDADTVFEATGIATRTAYGVSIFEFELASSIEDKDPNDERELGVPFCVFEATAQEPSAPDAAPHG